MTIYPQAPVFAPVAGSHKTKQLAQDHLTFIPFGFGYSLMVLIKAGFETDGASVPDNLLDDKDYGSLIESFIRTKFPLLHTREEMQNLISSLVGTPWDMPRLLAAIVHDALYGRKWRFRWLCDRIYRKILVMSDYSPMRTDIEYAGIRLMGWRYWNAVSDWKKAQTKKQTKIAFVRTKNISALINKFTPPAAE